MTTVFVSAGEPSGDAHAAAFVKALKEQVPGVRVEGIGGGKMADAGVEIMERMENFTVIGFVEVLKKVPAHLRLLRRIERRLKAGDVKLLVLVDYPGFHMRVARAAKKLGVPVLYYIAPQLWAWHESRVKTMARDVAQLAVILPFEEGFFAARGVATTFVGHPLLDRSPAAPDRASAKRQLGLDPSRPVLGLFPGSRTQEAARLWPVFRDAAKLVRRQRPDVQCLVAAASGATYEGAEGVLVAQDRPGECFAAADVALSKSGTTTIEAALAGVPQVIAYRMNAVSYFLARRLVKVPWIGMVNLVAGKQVAPELVQSNAEPVQLAAALMPLLDEASPERKSQLEGIALVKQRLGGPGAARRAAEIAKRMLAA
ncbi:MAG TPA: lipid-A-disaccharide synthase [Gemmatimonadales bacterium]